MEDPSNPSAPQLPPPILALTPGTLEPGDRRAADELVQRVRAAVSGGLGAVLLREPGLPDAELVALAQTLSGRFEDLWLGVHDRVHLARAVGAQGVHVGARSLTPAELRTWLPAELALGLSTHTADHEARWAGADYLFHGPVHMTPKPYLVEPIGFSGLRAAVERSPAPIWALGGLGPGDVAGALEAGAGGVAVLSGILPTPDPKSAAESYAAALPGR